MTAVSQNWNSSEQFILHCFFCLFVFFTIISVKYFSVCKIYLGNEVSQNLENAAEELT